MPDIGAMIGGLAGGGRMTTGDWVNLGVTAVTGHSVGEWFMSMLWDTRPSDDVFGTHRLVENTRYPHPHAELALTQPHQAARVLTNYVDKDASFTGVHETTVPHTYSTVELFYVQQLDYVAVQDFGSLKGYDISMIPVPYVYADTSTKTNITPHASGNDNLFVHGWLQRGHGLWRGQLAIVQAPRNGDWSSEAGRTVYRWSIPEVDPVIKIAPLNRAKHLILVRGNT